MKVMAIIISFLSQCSNLFPIRKRTPISTVLLHIDYFLKKKLSSDLFVKKRAISLPSNRNHSDINIRIRMIVLTHLPLNNCHCSASVKNYLSQESFVTEV